MQLHSHDAVSVRYIKNPDEFQYQPTHCHNKPTRWQRAAFVAKLTKINESPVTTCLQFPSISTFEERAENSQHVFPLEHRAELTKRLSSLTQWRNSLSCTGNASSGGKMPSRWGAWSGPSWWRQAEAAGDRWELREHHKEVYNKK